MQTRVGSNSGVMCGVEAGSESSIFPLLLTAELRGKKVQLVPACSIFSGAQTGAIRARIRSLEIDLLESGVYLCFNPAPMTGACVSPTF
jgi:hypothetical protein